MTSIIELKKRLPKEFVENLYEMFTPITIDNILKGMLDKRYLTLRVNTIKYNAQDLMKYFKENNIKFERVNWYSDAFIIKNFDEKDIQKLDIYKNGYIYLQSLSSMIPPIVLNPKSGERVLDLTAAPGSKTTQMSAMMQNNGYILANELDKIRCERLKYNIDIQGATIVDVVNERGEKIFEKYNEFFDKVLLDAPCSGEGRFLTKFPGTYRDWSYKRVNQLAKMQKKLFESAYNSLKAGGEMVYSTCTLNMEENENILNWAINNFNIKLIKTNIEIRDTLPNLDNKLSYAIKVLPTKTMEGFFIAKLVKNSKN